MSVWPVQDAKARFSEMLDRALKEGPQVVTRRGVETAVLVPISQWKRLCQPTQPSLKNVLLSPEARFDCEAVLPDRKRFRRRAGGSLA